MDTERRHPDTSQKMLSPAPGLHVPDERDSKSVTVSAARRLARRAHCGAARASTRHAGETKCNGPDQDHSAVAFGVQESNRHSALTLRRCARAFVTLGRSLAVQDWLLGKLAASTGTSPPFARRVEPATPWFKAVWLNRLIRPMKECPAGLLGLSASEFSRQTMPAADAPRPGRFGVEQATGQG